MASMTIAAPSSLPLALPWWQRALIWACVLAVLLGVFALYTLPDFMVTLAGYIWACF